MFLRHDWGCLIFNLTCLRKLQVRPVVISFYTPIQSYLTFAILFQYVGIQKMLTQKVGFHKDIGKVKYVGTSFQYVSMYIVRTCKMSVSNSFLGV